MARSNQKVVPEAKEALDRFKYEVASDMCVKNIFTLISSSYFIFLRTSNARPYILFLRAIKIAPTFFYAGCFN